MTAGPSNFELKRPCYIMISLYTEYVDKDYLAGVIHVSRERQDFDHNLDAVNSV